MCWFGLDHCSSHLLNGGLSERPNRLRVLAMGGAQALASGASCVLCKLASCRHRTFSVLVLWRSLLALRHSRHSLHDFIFASRPARPAFHVALRRPWEDCCNQAVGEEWHPARSVVLCQESPTAQGSMPQCYNEHASLASCPRVVHIHVACRA